MSVVGSEIVEGLAKSEKTVGQLTPVYVTKDGEIIDGFHRKSANPQWREEVLENIETREDYLKARIAFNYRRVVKRDEMKALIIELADILLSKGVPKGELAKKLAEITPYAEKTIINLLPAKYKVVEKREAGRISARVRAERVEEAEAERPEERIPTIFTAQIECPLCHEQISLEVNCRERNVTIKI